MSSLSRQLIVSALVVLAVGAGVLSCGAPPQRLREDAYVWQRAITPAVAEAVRSRGRSFDALRVLAEEIEASPTAVGDPRTFIGMHVIAVIRVDGTRVADDAQLVAEARRTITRFHDAGVELVGLEIDHDCAVSKLAGYAATLTKVKEAIAPLPLSITALPSWAPSAALDQVMTAADSVVLQVHAVDHPEDGLFQERRAHAAIRAFAQRTRKPFFVALPAYGSALALADDGTVIGVESEEPRALGPRKREVWAEPAEVEALLRALDRDRPARLAGIVWFRLPVGGDQRAWSFETLQAVRAHSVVTRTRVHMATDGSADIVVDNTGSVDAVAPGRVDVDGRVSAADGVRGYRFDGRALVSSTPPRLRPGEQLVIGWARGARVRVSSANHTAGSVDAEP